MNYWQILALGVSALWSFFKASGFCEMKRLAGLERLFQAIEIGVSEAWREVVKPWLDANPTPGKLPAHIKEAAERHAIKVAAENDKIVEKYDDNTIRATVMAVVEESKRRGGK